MENKMKNENEIIEVHSSKSGSAESMCSSCKLEVSEIDKNNGTIHQVVAEVHKEPEDDMLEDLLEASKSLSQISVHDDDVLDFDVDQETLFDLENAANSRRLKSLSKDSSVELVSAGKIKEYSSATNELMKNSTIGKERNSPTDLLDDSDDDTDFVLRMSSLREGTQQPLGVSTEPQVSESDEPPKKRSKLTDKVVFKETTEATDLNNSWDADFPPETELQKLDDSIRQLTQQNLEKTFKSTSEDKDILPLVPVNCKGIAETLTNRKRHIHALVNNVYEASRYLDDVRKVLAAASSGPVVIPPPPKVNGYDKQFDFPERNRFSKLPITIESARGSKGDDLKENSFPKPQSNSSSTLGKSKKSTSTKSSNSSITALKPSTKAMNNRIEIALPDRFKKQQSIKEMFSGGNKENRGIGSSNNNGGLMNNSSEKDTLSDSGSMYEFNPLIRARKPTK